MSDTDKSEQYDELDEKIIDALAIDPKVHWSYEQRKAVKALITQQCNQARIDERVSFLEALKKRGLLNDVGVSKLVELQAQAKETEGSNGQAQIN